MRDGRRWWQFARGARLAIVFVLSALVLSTVVQGMNASAAGDRPLQATAPSEAAPSEIAVCGAGFVDVAPFDPLDGKPVDELRRRLLAECLQHRAPAADLHLGTPLEAAHHRLDAQACRRIQFVGVVVEALGQELSQPRKRSLQPRERTIEFRRGLEQARHGRFRLGLQPIRSGGMVSAGVDLLPHAGEERFGRAVRCIVDQSLMPRLARQHARRAQCLRQHLFCRLVAGDQILDPAPQAARPAPGALGDFGVQPMANTVRFLVIVRDATDAFGTAWPADLLKAARMDRNTLARGIGTSQAGPG